MRLIKIVLGLILAIHFTHSWAEDTEAKSSPNTKATIQQPTSQDDDEIDAAPDNNEMSESDTVESK